MLNCAETAAVLRNWDNILVLSHASPDGDTLGSACALMRGLLALGKRARFACADTSAPKYGYLFDGMPQEDFAPEHVMTVDVADLSLLGGLREQFEGRIELAVDHHGTHVPFAPQRWVEPHSAATTELVFLLLQELGYDVTGVTFKLWKDPQEESGCCSADDVNDARYVCHQLGIPHYVFNYQDLFRERVVDAFAREYAQGRTPNPCILCNRYVKFEAFLRRAQELGADFIATGHYARVERDPSMDRWVLRRGAVPRKDQSYVLYTLTQEELSHLLLPLGGYAKEEIRRIAEENDLVVARKPDSQDICFVPDGDYGAFLERYTGEPARPGLFVDEQGTPLGEHRGIRHYTVGQRKGLGIALGRPMFVQAVSPGENTVTLVDEERKLFRREVLVGEVNWIARDGVDGSTPVEAKIRYSQNAAPAVLKPLENGRVLLTFSQPQRAPTPGQAAVFYQGDTVLGGGTILEEPFDR